MVFHSGKLISVLVSSVDGFEGDEKWEVEPGLSVSSLRVKVDEIDGYYHSWECSRQEM